MKVELFYTPVCPNCPKAKAIVRPLVKDRKDIDYSELNAFDHQDRVMELNFKMVPTIVIDGKVWVSGIPDEDAFLKMIS